MSHCKGPECSHEQCDCNCDKCKAQQDEEDDCEEAWFNWFSGDCGDGDY